MNAKKELAFSVSENQIREDFINYLLKEKEIPPDACISAQIVKIKKHYQLSSKCEGQYTTHWSAKCTWEHTEKYTYTDTEIVFVDDYGIERPYRQDGWTPVPKQVTKTDHKIITDKVEQVNRDIKDNYCELIHAQGEASPLYNWIIERFKNSKYTAVELSDNDLLECNITEQRNMIKVLQSAQDNCKSACLSRVKAIIPGNRYENFKFDFKSDFKISEEFYIPVYQVEYTYNHKQYEVWFSGYEKGVWFSEKTPKNSNIKSHKKLYATSISAFLIDAALLIIMAIIGKFNMIPTIPILFTIIILLFGVFIICLITGVVLDNSTVNTERRDDIKNLLTQVYHNQDMTLQAKKSEMKQAVKEFDANETKISNRRKKCILIPSISILVIALSFFMTKQVILPTVNYNNAEKLLSSGEYDKAISAFKNLGDFKNSENKVAEAYVTKGDYISAINLYNKLGDKEKVKEYTPLAIDQQVKESKKVARQAKIGNVICIGNYEAVVLDKQSDKILIMVIRYNGNDSYRNLNTVYNMIYDYNSSSWKNSYIRSFLNNDFLDEFSESINRIILEVNLPNITQSGKNLGKTKDKVFLLSAVSDKKYIDALIDNGVIITSTMFTRTPSSSTTVVSVDVENNFDGTGNHYSMGEQESSDSYYVRPCMWLDIS